MNMPRSELPREERRVLLGWEGDWGFASAETTVSSGFSDDVVELEVATSLPFFFRRFGTFAGSNVGSVRQMFKASRTWAVGGRDRRDAREERAEVGVGRDKGCAGV